MTWKADSLQGVVFSLPGTPQLDAQQVWQHVTKGLPETLQRPAMNPAGLSIASGPFAGHRLTIQSQLGRVDFILNASPPNSPSPEPPTIADYASALGTLDEMLTSALTVVQPIRVAMVGEFGRHFSSDSEVVDFLTSETGGVWFTPPVQDCIYQVNARRKYPGDSGYEMNRLVNWSGAMYAMITTQFMGLGQPQGASTTRTIPAASLKVDVNSHTSSDIAMHADHMIKANSSEVLAVVASGISRLKSL